MTEIDDVTSLACACCGEPRTEPELTRMACRPDVAICSGCVEWMSAHTHARPSLTPIFPVRDMTEAREFWTRAGVTVELFDTGYAFVLVNGAELAHLDLRPDLEVASNPTACYLHVEEPDAWHARWQAARLPVSNLKIEPWGMTEFNVTDPSGNRLRIGGNTSTASPDGQATAALGTSDPVAVAAVQAIHAGDVPRLRELLSEHQNLATARLGDDEPNGMSRTLLHVVTDWPGHFPHGADVVRALVEAGADVNARFRGPHEETPLHWAASSNDVAVLDALLDFGADIDAPGAVIAGGTPLADARAFGNWEAGLRLVERGARTTLIDCATLGLIDRVEAAFGAAPGPAAEETNRAFWGACHGGRRNCAEYLVARGADLNWIPDWERLTPLDAARRREATDLVAWLQARGGRSAEEIDPRA
ncbi:MAG: ankyrin repeat domain-containing protein [Pseudonocardia sp.]|nr:ankyrin repeat domain-containing protein [Pseudonocardia sp.]